MISSNSPADFMPSFSVSSTRHPAPRDGQLGRGVDAGQQIHASQQVRRIDGSFLDFFTFFIGRADDAAALESTAGDQHGKDVPVVMATPFQGGSQDTFGVLPNSPVHQNQGALQQLAIAQIPKERRQSLVQTGTLCPHGGEVVGVRVPAPGKLIVM